MTPPDSVAESSAQSPTQTLPQTTNKAVVTTKPAAWRLLEELKEKQNLDLLFREIVTLRPKTNDVLQSNLVLPYYRQGMHAGYLRTGEGRVVQQQNVDLSVLRVSKEFRKEGSAMFYSQHAFHFDDPVNALWWVKHIGEVNLSNIRLLSIRMYCGYDEEMYRVDNLDQSHEEMWHQFFTWLKPRHQLEKIVINFSDWVSVRDACPGYSRWQPEVQNWHQRIRSVLWSFRGLKSARLIDSRGYGLTEQDRKDYSLMMVSAPRVCFPAKEETKPVSKGAVGAESY